MAKGYKSEMVQSSIGGALADAHSELEELSNELEEWRDNLEGGNMDHIPKYDEVCEAADSLGSAIDHDLNDVAAEFDGSGFDVTEQIEFTHSKPYGKRSPSRSTRRDNICNKLEAVIESVQERVERATAALETLNDIKEEIENVEFPGMFS